MNTELEKQLDKIEDQASGDRGDDYDNVSRLVAAVKQSMDLIEFIGLGDARDCKHCEADKSKAKMTEELILLHLKGPADEG